MKKQIQSQIIKAATLAFPDASPAEIERMAENTSLNLAGLVACYQPDLALEDMQRSVLELSDLLYQTYTSENKSRQTELENKIATVKTIPGYEEPVLVSVKNIVNHAVLAGKKSIKPGEVAQVYPWEFRALARFLAIQR